MTDNNTDTDRCEFNINELAGILGLNPPPSEELTKYSIEVRQGAQALTDIYRQGPTVIPTVRLQYMQNIFCDAFANTYKDRWDPNNPEQFASQRRINMRGHTNNVLVELAVKAGSTLIEAYRNTPVHDVHIEINPGLVTVKWGKEPNKEIVWIKCK